MKCEVFCEIPSSSMFISEWVTKVINSEETFHEWWRDAHIEENQKVKALFYYQGKKMLASPHKWVLIIVLSNFLGCVFCSPLFRLGRVCVCVCVCVCMIFLYTIYHCTLGVMGEDTLCYSLYVPSPQKKQHPDQMEKTIRWTQRVHILNQDFISQTLG